MRPWSLRTSTCACSLAIMGLQPGRLRLHPGYTWLPPGYVRLQHDHLRLGCSLDDCGRSVRTGTFESSAELGPFALGISSAASHVATASAGRPSCSRHSAAFDWHAKASGSACGHTISRVRGGEIWPSVPPNQG